VDLSSLVGRWLESGSITLGSGGGVEVMLRRRSRVFRHLNLLM